MIMKEIKFLHFELHFDFCNLQFDLCYVN